MRAGAGAAQDERSAGQDAEAGAARDAPSFAGSGIVTDDGRVLAIDIGGTKTAIALVGRSGVPEGAFVGPTPAAQGPAAVIAAVAALALQACAAASVSELAAVGVGTAGVVDTRTGTIISATDTFAGWPGTPVADRLRVALGQLLSAQAPIVVQNDVDAHATGEFRYGAAAGASSALIIAVGTGVGGGLILDGAPVRGAHHVAGEIAHMPVPGAEHLRCPCGRLGHLEAIGSGVGMHRHYLALGGDRVVADARDVAAAAFRGDATAARALRESAAAVGRALAGAATLLDPERIVLTGGVPDIGDAWWQPMLDAYRAEVIDVLQATPVLPGVLGGDAPLRGAAAAAWDALSVNPAVAPEGDHDLHHDSEGSPT